MRFEPLLTLRRLSISSVTGSIINPPTNPDTSEPSLIQGGLINLFNYGVLLTGPSGVGKSELALALIDRGHQFVSDDVTLVQRDNQQLIGRAPKELAGSMQIHGCGLFSVERLYGNYRATSPLQLVIELAPHIEFEENPLEASRSSVNILDMEIPKLTVPLPKPRNLALIIELLVRKEIDKK